MAESALDRLKRLTAWDKDPALSLDDLNAILEAYQVHDAEGILPGEDGWVPTYRLNAAIVEAWEMKAGLSAEYVSTDMNGDRLSSNLVHDHCIQMAAKYRRKGSTSVSTAAGG
jgi:hypothetical protein